VNRGTVGANSLPKTVTRQRRGCDLNPGRSVSESSTLTTRLPSHPKAWLLLLYCHLNFFVTFYVKNKPDDENADGYDDDSDDEILFELQNFHLQNQQ